MKCTFLLTSLFPIHVEQNLRQQPIRGLPYLSANGKPELCIFRRGDWPTVLSIKTYDGQSTLTFKRGKIVVSFTLDGVDYLGDYHVKNVIFVRRPPPFLSTTLLQSSAHFSASLCVVHMHTNNECVCVCRSTFKPRT